jgi:protein TonB
MFGTLIESRAVTPRRTGGSIASILIHSAIITGGVIATAKDIVTMPTPDHDTTFVPYVRTVQPPPQAPRSVTVSSASIASTPIILRLNVPTIVPVGIPPIDLTAAATPAEFRSGPVGTTGILCERDCGGPIATDADGRQLWGANDLMMRLLEDPVPPRYPEVLRRAGVEGDVVVQFVVDTTGRIDMSAIQVMRSTHDAFTAAVRETLAKLRFAPATTGERKIRALAVMPFHFTLR